MKNHIFFLTTFLIAGIPTFLISKNLPFQVSGVSEISRSVFDDSLDQFLERCADNEDEKIEFRGYYSKFLEKQARTRRQSKHSRLRKLRSAALPHLEKSHPDWYKQIEPFVLDLEDTGSDTKKVRLFLNRYAVLIQYRDSQNNQSSTWWDTTKSYAKSMGSKLAGVKDRLFGAKEVKA